ncbi:flagellar hook-associated protein 3 [Thiospirochaeta perfilievii]|uniref:Flagellar hook-associated protein 3 n=1 Tax=Thiospirochaeta perfilievii TaxID=252967 RepID=A0A5C1QFI9_9SPIO|nr:flagellar hook-associated protein 3 [Thiospirochaeta perfilievii]QEN05819.1 flagellar hook-associated protein 3 [Thiospirochaeta perfilievii]
MRRISTNMPNQDFRYSLSVRNDKLNSVKNGISGQSKITDLRNDPIAAAHSTRLTSNIRHIDRYERNIAHTQEKYAIAEGYMSSGIDVMQRLKELNVQASQGTYNKEDLKIMASEVDQLLGELITIANGRDSDGSTIFSGERSDVEPFEVLMGHVEGKSGVSITEVNYTGTLSNNIVEISENSYVKENFPGNEVFWAENQTVYSSVDSSTYIATEDSNLSINGVDIGITSGDNVHTIIDKINKSDVAVRASLDPVYNSLVLNTTSPHQLMIEDSGNSMESLGILAPNNLAPPNNYNNSARVSGGSLFDAVISLRDNMLKGDVDSIGSKNLGQMELAFNNLTAKQAELGSLDERLNLRSDSLAYTKESNSNFNSLLTDIDMSEAIIEMNMLEYAQKASYQLAGKMFKTSLMDYIR